jgi:hypothetical protein
LSGERERERARQFGRARQPCHPHMGTVSEIEAPSKFDIEFSVNKNIYLRGLRFAAQIDKNNDPDDHYNETMHINIKKKGEKSCLASYTYGAQVKYGSVLDIIFKKPGQLESDQVYTVNFNIKSSGTYNCLMRGSTIYFEDLIAKFSSDCPHSGLLHSLILEDL